MKRNARVPSVDHAWLLALLIACTLVIGCHSDDPNLVIDDLHRPLPTLSFRPVDQQTGLTQDTLHAAVIVDNLDAPVDDTLMQALVHSVSLVRWPMRSVVSADAIAQNIARMGSAPAVTRVDIQPTEELTTDWYAILLDPLPTGFALHQPSEQASDGSVASRFHIGPSPTLLAIEVCMKAAPASVLIYDFSEPVEPQAPLAESISVGYESGGGPNCGFDAEAPAAGAASFESTCTSLDWHQTLHVHMEPFTSAATGAAATLGAAEYSFQPDALKDVGGNCKMFRP